MSLGGSSSSQKQQSQSSSSYDPQLTGLLVNRAHDANTAAAQNPYQSYSGTPLSYGAATIGAGAVPQVHAGQLSSSDLSGYMNPYTQDVVNTTTSALARQNQIDNTNAAGQATQAGAFGGSRSAVLQNLNTDSYQRNLGQTVAALNQANFGQAQGAAQSDIAGRMQADLANQGAAYNVANTNAANQNTASQFNSGQNWQQYLNAQNYPFLIQQMLNQSYGLLPSSPLSQSTSSGSGSSFGFSAAAK